MPPRTRLRRAPLALLGLALVTLVTSAQTAPRNPTGQTFRNPILPAGQDPSVVQGGAFYHLVQSDEDGISIRTSATLTGLGNAKKVVVWRGGQADSPCCELWAPELIRMDGKWYIYYAADDGRNENHRMYVLEAPAVTGPYTFRGQITDPTNRWAIDGTVLTAPGGGRYFVWSGWEGTENVQQNLYIAPMKNAWTLAGERVKISEPDQPWERIGQPYINEGPEVLVRNGRVFVVYSASGSWTDDYCLGLLSLTGKNVLDPAAWKKSDGCVFSRNDAASVYAPGHNGFVRSADGTENWHLYHAIQTPGASWGGRSIRAQKFAWNADGTPNFGRPAAFDTALPLPSGEYEAEQAGTKGVAMREEPLASGGRAARLDSQGDSVDFARVRAPKDGTYTLRVRASNGSGRPARLRVVVNGAPTTVTLPPGGWANFGTRPLTVRLRAGQNDVRLVQESGTSELDAITVTPGSVSTR